MHDRRLVLGAKAKREKSFITALIEYQPDALTGGLSQSARQPIVSVERICLVVELIDAKPTLFAPSHCNLRREHARFGRYNNATFAVFGATACGLPETSPPLGPPPR